MPASLRFLDTDGSTIIDTVNLGAVASPGTSADKLVHVQNFGDQTAQDVVASIEAVGTNDGDDFAEIAADSGGSPGPFDVVNIDLGNIDVLEVVPVWLRADVFTGVTPDQNPRRWNLKAAGITF